MSRARKCIIKAAALRAQADKLEKVAVLVDQDVDDEERRRLVADLVRETYGPGALIVAENGATTENNFVKGVLGLGALGVALGGAGLYSYPKIQERMAANYLKNQQGTLLARAGLAGAGLAGLGGLAAGLGVMKRPGHSYNVYKEVF